MMRSRPFLEIRQDLDANDIERGGVEVDLLTIYDEALSREMAEHGCSVRAQQVAQSERLRLISALAQIKTRREALRHELRHSGLGRAR